MSLLSPAAIKYLTEGHLGHLSTIKPDGSPHVTVAEGTAELSVGGAPAHLQKEAHIYLGPDVTFPGPDAPDGFILRMTPTKIRGVLPWE